MMDNIDDIIAGLEKMRDLDPDAYQQLITSLSNNNVIDGDKAADSINTNNNPSLFQMAEAIKEMRHKDIMNTTDSDLIMSKDKPKQPKGIHITPEAGFTFKTYRLKDSQKIFINMTQHEAISEPALKKKLDDQGEEVEGMNIPMSVGPAILSSDKKGNSCIVYDIIVHPIVINESLNDKTGKYRDFLCQLAIQYLEQKYKDELDKRYKLPKLKYMGEAIKSQFIQDRKNIPKIEEISSKNIINNNNSKTKNKKTNDVVVEVADKQLLFNTYWLINKEQLIQDSQYNDHKDIHIKFGESINTNKIILESYPYSLLDYIDPICIPTNNQTVGIMISSELSSYDIDTNNLTISISPYKIYIHMKGYKKYTLYLGTMINPIVSYYNLCRPYEGCISTIKLEIILILDTRPWNIIADIGSKTWLLSQALSTNDYENNNTTDSYVLNNPYLHEYQPDYATINNKNKNILNNSSNNKNKVLDNDENETYAEDKFHLKLPANVDPYTGATLDDDNIELKDINTSKNKSTITKSMSKSNSYIDNNYDEMNELLPEDRFHQKDAASSYLINQRDQAKKDKWDKYEKEKSERINDPNVEYIEMDDFRAGGKYGPKNNEKVINLTTTTTINNELKKASTVIASTQNLNSLEGLTSTLWTELLD